MILTGGTRTRVVFRGSDPDPVFLTVGSGPGFLEGESRIISTRTRNPGLQGGLVNRSLRCNNKF